MNVHMCVTVVFFKQESSRKACDITMYRTSNVRTADEPRRDHSEKRFVTKGFIEHASQ